MSSPSAWLSAGVGLLLAVSALLMPDSRPEVKTARTAPDRASDGPVKTSALRIDLSKAMKVNLPATSRDFEAASFGTPDGKSGWVLRLPGGRPIATPAYADGMLFVGGGYGSHEFYALDSETGSVIWKIQTGDDGPTAAVVDDGRCSTRTMPSGATANQYDRQYAMSVCDALMDAMLDNSGPPEHLHAQVRALLERWERQGDRPLVQTAS